MTWNSWDYGVVVYGVGFAAGLWFSRHLCSVDGCWRFNIGGIGIKHLGNYWMFATCRRHMEAKP